MTFEELQELQEANWSRVDAHLRNTCVWHLRNSLGAGACESLAAWFETGDWPIGFHMFGGMNVRNRLRQVVKDDQLPEIDGHRNWDDYYMAALRQAVNRREGES